MEESRLKFAEDEQPPAGQEAPARRMEAACYRSCLDLAAKQGLTSIAFCCISTGEFHFPNEKAAEIAVETVENYLKENGYPIKVIFNVFKDEDLIIYKKLLTT